MENCLASSSPARATNPCLQEAVWTFVRSIKSKSGYEMEHWTIKQFKNIWMKNRSVRFIIPLLMLNWCFWTGCYYDVEEELYPTLTPCDTTDLSFTRDINPILSNNCRSCHNASIANGGIRLDNYTEIKKQVDNGKLLSAIRQDNAQSKPMPPAPASPLASCPLQQIEHWIINGAPNN